MEWARRKGEYLVIYGGPGWDPLRGVGGLEGKVIGMLIRGRGGGGEGGSGKEGRGRRLREGSR